MVNIADFSLEFITIVIGTLVLAIFGIFFGLIYKGIDRKLSACHLTKKRGSHHRKRRNRDFEGEFERIHASRMPHS